ncbi:hypothetical protein A3D84_03180 [Candidatus Woesebacteria bacterium RIFCSPHIGHO2_02_FULL_42_20]|uniref:Serine hydrolase family protein n=1 Tax=Candidatus Woesebacteria bacterium RIFCSPHIGHO2_12_FULL_41_24 TaxID=1802510 RepID=A0A1F8ARU0_9BACT|nr:MAG: hypothetical protein A2W15_03370 [Candidatus Woesebacteria bacterium RBG_16_41_13]OGM29395.1 MAG: hypothetical protein A2873_04625 [Candidatus Woesebacteria bacterium RIFCSPHIGHO2_01_FULL_42_80]OGM34844.1 MAG: hypothetical protein A3D84_03180 [Candidatus Woesebacteria bacterium RIFCSPHIGHO2_02_FULL_42_20]OGM54473.1 MAG: hypothetical protein A3E44_00215 [Candidatus Woesebacteria bacterium RIFCSPHIGHO2_12_FULL_41_24]OGM65717.1 MAG: hypothetical protein A2969_00615 [Candidatus Woesebacteri
MYLTRRIFLIHGWGGSPKNDWFPWAKEELSKSGFDVIVPEMPETNHPKIGLWTNKLKMVVGKPKRDDIFVGHSVGCQAILRYLETISDNVDKVVLIAPWWYLTLDKNEEQSDADPWLKADVDFDKVKSKANKFIAVFSDDDLYVPLQENGEFFKEKINPEILVENKMGHFTESDGVNKIPFLTKLVKQSFN